MQAVEGGIAGQDTIRTVTSILDKTAEGAHQRGADRAELSGQAVELLRIVSRHDTVDDEAFRSTLGSLIQSQELEAKLYREELGKMKNMLTREQIPIDELINRVEDGLQRARGQAKKRANDAGEERYGQHYREMQALLEDKDEEVQEEEEEVAITAADVSTICPISRKQFVNPVKNKECGHVYSKDAIRNYLGQLGGRHNPECPVAGCRARVVQPLAPDHAMERRLRRSKGKKRSRAIDEEVTQV